MIFSFVTWSNFLSNTNCKGSQTINAANVGSTREDSETSSAEKMWNRNNDCKAITTWKTFLDTKMTRTDIAGSQQWTAVSLFLELISTVAKICNASPTANVHNKWVQIAELDIVNGSFCNLCTLAVRLALHIFATQCWRAQKRAKQLSTVAILLYRFLSCWFFLKRFSCNHDQPCIELPLKQQQLSNSNS